MTEAVSDVGDARGRSLPELALIAATVAYGATFKLVQDALDDVTPVGFILLRFAVGAIVLAAVRAPARLAPARRGRGVTRPRLRASRCSRSARSAFAGYWFQNVGLERTTTSNSAFITGLVRRVHAADRDRR